MKYILYAAIFVVIALQVNAQAPAGFNYQGIVRNNAGAPLASQAIAIQASILQDTATGAVIYTEVQHVTTSSTGYFTIQIGKGAATTGSFAQINWGDGRNKWLQISVDATGGSSYKLIGSSQLVSVPYALYANNSGPAGAHYGDLLYWDGTKWTVLPEGNGGQVLTMTQTKDFSPDGTGAFAPTWTGGPYPAISTVGPTSIKSNTAVAGVHVINAYNVAISTGIYVSTDSIPLSGAVNGKTYGHNGGDTLFTITNLSASTKYYVRAVGYNAFTSSNSAKVWGNQVTFTTAGAVVPTLTTKILATTRENVWCSSSATDDGGSPITSKGFVIGTSPNPDTVTALKFAYGSGDTGYFKSDLTGLASNTKYYVRSYAVNSAGVGYGPTIALTTSSNPYSVGQPYGGGIIYYVDATGQHGLIAATADQGGGDAPWVLAFLQDGVSDTSQAIGKGAANTAYIVAVQGPGRYAASICTGYTGGGFSDWFLPSANELRTLFVNRNVVDGFDDADHVSYWSSTENPAKYSHSAFYIPFWGAGSKYSASQTNWYRVRPVRAF